MEEAPAADAAEPAAASEEEPVQEERAGGMPEEASHPSQSPEPATQAAADGQEGLADEPAGSGAGPAADSGQEQEEQGGGSSESAGPASQQEPAGPQQAEEQQQASQEEPAEAAAAAPGAPDPDPDPQTPRASSPTPPPATDAAGTAAHAPTSPTSTADPGQAAPGTGGAPEPTSPNAHAPTTTANPATDDSSPSPSPPRTHQFGTLILRPLSSVGGLRPRKLEVMPPAPAHKSAAVPAPTTSPPRPARSLSPGAKRRHVLAHEHGGIPGFISTPGSLYGSPPAVVLRSHGLQLQYQFGKVAPLGPVYAPAWVCDPPQRASVSDFRLQPSQRSTSCYSPEFVMQSSYSGVLASHAAALHRHGTGPHHTVPTTRAGSARPADGGPAPPGAALSPRGMGGGGEGLGSGGHVGTAHDAQPAHAGAAYGSRPAGGRWGEQSLGTRVAYHRAPGWQSPDHGGGTRRGVAHCSATEVLRATARSTFAGYEPPSKLVTATKSIGLSQTRTKHIALSAAHPRGDGREIDVVLKNRLVPSHEDLPKLKFKERLAKWGM